MAKIKLVKGSVTPTKRNVISFMSSNLVYVNTLLLLALLIKSFIK